MKCFSYDISVTFLILRTLLATCALRKNSVSSQFQPVCFPEINVSAFLCLKISISHVSFMVLGNLSEPIASSLLQFALIARYGVASVMSGELEQVLVTRVGRFSFETIKSDSPILPASLSPFGYIKVSECILHQYCVLLRTKRFSKSKKTQKPKV